uniref:Thioredoxin domain-containing protein n=1 Tax=viral metagenome TaxID=1070528 RepID=A0A6C0HRS6_9ZZZZ
MNIYLLGFFVFLLVLVIVGFYFLYKKQVPKGEKKAEFLFFYTDWCPHCTSAKPEWAAFKKETTTVNGYTITYNDVNCTKESATSESMMEKYKVEGFPTIKLVVNGKVYDFDSKPTKQNLTQFVNNTLH